MPVVAKPTRVRLPQRSAASPYPAVPRLRDDNGQADILYDGLILPALPFHLQLYFIAFRFIRHLLRSAGTPFDLSHLEARLQADGTRELSGMG